MGQIMLMLVIQLLLYSYMFIYFMCSEPTVPWFPRWSLYKNRQQVNGTLSYQTISNFLKRKGFVVPVNVNDIIINVVGMFISLNICIKC